MGARKKRLLRSIAAAPVAASAAAASHDNATAVDVTGARARHNTNTAAQEPIPGRMQPELWFAPAPLPS